MDYWKIKTKRLLKSELTKRGVSHEALALRLNQIGIDETKSSIDSKISRGTFSAAFLFQCLYVLDCKFFQLDIDSNPLLVTAEPIVEYQTKSQNG